MEIRSGDIISTEHYVSSKQKRINEAVDDSMYRNPYENLSLVNMGDEIWKPFPVSPYDERYEISNKGRVKRIEHNITRIDGITTTLPERVQKLRLQYYFNRYLKEKTYQLVCRVTSDGTRVSFPLSRVVYLAFVEDFDIYDKKVYVRYKDGNGLNCIPENLFLFERNKLTKWLLDNGRKYWLSGASDRSKYSKEEVEKWDDINRKPVNQYDLKGNFIQTFKSRTAAAKAVRVNSVSISAVIRNKIPTAGGYIWRSGLNPPSRIDVRFIRQPVKVAQYTLSGELIQVFSSIKVAAENINLSTAVVADRIYGRAKQKGDFILKVAEGTPAEVKAKVKPNPQYKTHDCEKYGIPKDKKYPFQNFSLDDIEGEVWKVIPNTNNEYEISNMGRVKSVERVVYRSKSSYLKTPQILFQAINQKKKVQPFLVANIRINKTTRGFLATTLVYTNFIGEIPSQYCVINKDGDPFNCKAENLALQSISEIFKEYHKQGRLKGIPSKPIAQYTLDGKCVATYSSMNEARKQTGFPIHGLSDCANGKRDQFKGFKWKFV